jgi:proline iminopeptidase
MRMRLIVAAHTALLAATMPVLIAAVASAQAPRSEQGFVTAEDGTRLYFHRVGSGNPVVIIPGALFMEPAFDTLARGRTLVFYDMRNRGRSDAVRDSTHVSIDDDVRDLEQVRKHIGANRVSLVGFSYLGMMVTLYASRHAEHVERVVQLGPVSRRYGTRYPKTLTANDPMPVPDSATNARLKAMRDGGVPASRPREYCEEEYKATRVMLVGNPLNAGRVPNGCEFEREWPVHLGRHFQTLFTSIARLDTAVAPFAALRVPVLTIHGTKDRNAPYGSGREWAMTLPNARLLTVPGAAHMSWIDQPALVFSAIDRFLAGGWPAGAQHVTVLDAGPP